MLPYVRSLISIPVCDLLDGSGVPSPVKPGDCNMVIQGELRRHLRRYRISGGHRRGAEGCDFIIKEMGATKIRFPENVGGGIKPVSVEGTQRLVRKAIQYAIDQDLPSVTLVHKGNIMKFTEGAFRDWGYELAQSEFGGELLDGGPWVSIKNPRTGNDIVIKDVIADAMLQQVLTRPRDYRCRNPQSEWRLPFDALAAQVGGIGIAPGANLSDTVALLRRRMARRLSTPARTRSIRIAHPLSAEMLRHLGWNEAADLIIDGMNGAIQAAITYDFERLMEEATLVSCSAFGEAVMAHM